MKQPNRRIHSGQQDFLGIFVGFTPQHPAKIQAFPGVWGGTAPSDRIGGGVDMEAALAFR